MAQGQREGNETETDLHGQGFILGHQTLDPDPQSGSAIRKNAGSGSGLNRCGSATLQLNAYQAGAVGTLDLAGFFGELVHAENVCAQIAALSKYGTECGATPF